MLDAAKGGKASMHEEVVFKSYLLADLVCLLFRGASVGVSCVLKYHVTNRALTWNKAYEF